MVDIVRDPRWGRVMESFGEDKKLNADFGSAMVRGYQGESLKDSEESLAACIKHFAAYGAVQGEEIIILQIFLSMYFEINIFLHLKRV